MGYGVFEELEKLKKKQEESRKKYSGRKTVTPVPTDTDYGVFNELNKLQQKEEDFREALTVKKQTEKPIETSRSVGGGSFGDDDIAPVREDRTWLQKGAMEDGWSLRNIGKTILGTATDVAENLGTGIIGMGEKLVDSLAYVAPYLAQGQYYQTGGAYQSVENQKAFEDSIAKEKVAAAEFIKKDLYDEEKVSKAILSRLGSAAYLGSVAQGGGQITQQNLDISNQMQQSARNYLDKQMDADSVLGEKADSMVQSVGQMGATIGLQAVGIPWYLTTGVTSFGGEAENALKQGATMEEAGLSAAITAGSEILTEKLFGGSGLGEKGLINLEPLTRGITQKTVKTLADYGVDMAAEGAEEVVTEVISNLGSALYKEENLGEILASEEALEGYLDAFIGGAALGGTMNIKKTATSVKNKTDYRSDLSTTEQKVVDKEYQSRLAEREKTGKLTNKQKDDLYNQVIEQMDKGYISTDTIEEVLGGDTYKSYQDTVKSEDSLIEQEKKLTEESEKLEGMVWEKMTGQQQVRRDELRTLLPDLRAKIKDQNTNSQRGALKTKLSEEVKNLVQGENSRLLESYREADRHKQRIEVDLNQYQDANARKTAESLSQVLDNSNKARDVLALMTKVAEDRGVSFTAADAQKFEGTSVALKRVKEFTADGNTTQYDIGSTNLNTDFKPVVTVDSQVVDNYSVDYKTGRITFETAPVGKVSVEFRKDAYVNGKLADGSIAINMRSKKYLESLVGHEVTHTLENTEFYDKLQSYIFEYAKKKGEYETRYKQLADLYNGIEGTSVEAELTADLVGDYLFQDSDFIMNLSTEHRNIFQKIYDEIKYLFKAATAGSEQARKLEQVKKAFEDAWRESGKKNTADGGVKYSLRKDIVDVNGNEYDSVVELDKTVSQRTLSDPKRFLNYIEKNLVGLKIPVVDGSGNTEIIEFAGANETVSKNNKRHPVLGELAYAKGDTRKQVIVNAKEVIEESVHDPAYPSAGNEHGWLDKNGWETRKTYVLAQDDMLYEAYLKIAKAQDGRNILYAVNLNIKNGIAVDKGATSKKAAVLAAMPSGEMVAQKDGSVKEQFSLSNPNSNLGSEVTEEQNESGLDVKSEVRYSLSHDTEYMDKAVALNNSVLHVSHDAMVAAKAVRERIATRMTEIKDRGLVGIPEDIEGNTYIANSSYDGTEENTTICPRSLASEAFTDAVSEYLGRPLTVEEQIYISQDLQGRSLTPECTYCYVATDRKAYRAFLGEYINQRDAVLQKVQENPSADVSRNGSLYKEFLNGRKDTKPMYDRFKMWIDAYKTGKPMIEASNLANISKLMGDINSTFGAELKPQIVDAMKYAQSASWAKKRINYVAYNGHILKWNQDRINKLNSHYGLRMYSFSDFHPAFVLENMQMITDASVRGLKMLGYTKDIDFVEIFAPSGMNINVSTFGFETGGNVYENNVIGAEWEKAKALREQYPNVGVTFVATNDNLVNWALEQDWIDVVIPYHLVRTGAEVAKAFGYTNYTSESSDVKNAEWTKGKDKKYISPTEHNNDKTTYLSALEANHLKPRFERFIDNPNYMKLVNESRQSASQSKPVQPVFNEDAAMVALAKLEANGYYQPIGGSVDRMYEIAAEVAEDMTKQLAPSRHSLSDLNGEQNRYGDSATLGEEVLYRDEETVAEAAPVEEIAPVAATPEVQEPAEELFPDDLAPVQQEYAFPLAEREDIMGAMDARSAIGDTTGVESLMPEYEAVQARIAEIERDEADRLASLEDADAPQEMDNAPEDVADNVPLTKTLVTELAKTVKAQLGLPNNRTAEVRELIERYSAEEFPSSAHLYTEIAERFGNYTEKYVDNDLKGIKSMLRTTGIYVDDIIKGDIADYGSVMRKNFGRVRFSKEGLPVDVAYQEFSSVLPGLFPESIDVPSDQLLRIIEVANMETTVENQMEIDSETLEQVTDTIVNGVNAFRQNRKETLANKHGRESFDSLMASADQYVPPVRLQNNPPARAEMNAPAEIAPVFDTADGQQAFMPEEEVPKKLTRSVLHENIMDNIKTTFRERGFELDNVFKNAKDLSTFATVDNTPQRVMEKALGYKQGQVLSDLTVNKVAQNETEGIRWLNSFTDKKNGLLKKISRQYGIKPGSKASAAAQMYAEGFYVGENDAIIEYGDKELAVDFPDVQEQASIKGLARDPRIRQIYDETLAAINESRTRNAYPEIPRLENYFLHFRAMEDTFSRLGLPFNPNDIRAKDLPTDLNGVTADLKPGQPYFASSMHRKGKRTSFDLLGGLEKYLTSAKNQIYHIDDIQTLRALRNYVAETYGQARGLEDLDLLNEDDAQQRIEQVYESHLSTFAKFLNEEANVLAGKTSLIDRGLEGVIGRRGITFLDTLNRQVGANMVGFNVSSSLTNLIAPVQAFAKSNKFDFVKAMAQTSANKIGSVFGKSDGFAENSPVMIRRKGADSFYRTPYQKVADAGYVMMGVIDNLSTELIARTKYNELTRKGMDSQQAHFETDKWVSRLMGDRSIGQQPQLYNSKMLGLITKFQLEVRNQLDSQFYDTIQEAKVSTEEIESKLLRNAKKAAKITSTFVQLAVMQHLFGKAFESVAGYNPAFDIIEALIKTMGWDDEEEDEDTVLDNIQEGFLSLLGDLPYTSTLTGGRIPISSALPVTELIKGEDQYGNEKSRWETALEAAPYYILPGGYGQIKKTYQGLGMFDEAHPIAGSYTDSGNLRFPVEDTIGNRVQAGLFGQWASENARDYFDNERKPLKKNQIQELIDVDLPIKDYWKYREGLSGLDKLGEKADYIDSLDLTTEQKNILINNIADRKENIDMADYGDYRNFEEFDFASMNPEKYAFLQENGISYQKYKHTDEVFKKTYDWAFKNPEKYAFLKENNVTLEGYAMFTDDAKEAYDWAYQNPEKFTLSKAVSSSVVTYRQFASELNEIRADKDENDKTISGSAKAKKIDYINSLDIDYGARLILFKNEYNADDTYNYEIIDYVNSRDDFTYEERVTILSELGFKILEDGTVQW